MKKKVFILLFFAMMFCLGGCAGTGAESVKDDRLQIVTTIFPEYDWVMNLLGEESEHAEVTMLTDSGADLHNFQASAEDILRISSCDLFIYVGGESDLWVDEVIRNPQNEGRIVINLMDELGEGLKEEELVEGMEEECEGEEEETEYDEHVWLSLNNASMLCTSITEALVKLDPEHEEVYRANLEAYVEKLSALDGKYRAAVEAAQGKTLLFGDRFPFRYLTDDYGLEYYAAFAGCSSESEASFETIVFLSDRINEQGISTILTIEGGDGRLADTVRENTKTKDQQILIMDSLQAVTASEVAEGISYLGKMEKNLDVLKAALE